ncbi:MAG: 4-hydroxy-tetrahydrodipicolinate synthase [Defluviitaleaceae bacterium]|nr:4-hydroxy-tetrahydrodipicolinate synthase [Defluviitaleaceae bacterium]
MAIFVGSGAATCTPFDKNDRFDAQVYERLIDFQIREGTDAIVSCGSTGEASTLEHDEHIEVVRVAVAAAKAAGAKYGRKVPVIAGAGGNDTAYCIQLGQELLNVGADALMYVTPYYNKTSQEGLVVHYTKVAAAVDGPIVLYNVPSRTGLNIKASTVERLAKVPNIVAIKEASGDIVQVTEIKERCGDDIDIYAGNDDYVLPLLAVGGVGVISTTANIAPAGMHNIVAKFMAGDIKGSRELQLGLMPLVRMMFWDVNPMPVKAALRMMGYEVGLCRMPLIDISDEMKVELEAQLRRYKLL